MKFWLKLRDRFSSKEQIMGRSLALTMGVMSSTIITHIKIPKQILDYDYMPIKTIRGLDINGKSKEKQCTQQDFFEIYLLVRPWIISWFQLF